MHVLRAQRGSVAGSCSGTDPHFTLAPAHFSKLEITMLWTMGLDPRLHGCGTLGGCSTSLPQFPPVEREESSALCTQLLLDLNGRTYREHTALGGEVEVLLLPCWDRTCVLIPT